MQLSLGSVTSKPCEATAAENYSDRIFALTPSASTVAVTADKDNVFQMCFVDPNQGTASAQYIAEQKLGTKVAIIWKNDDVYSTGIHDKFVEEAKTKGLQVVSDNTFTDASANDFSVQLKTQRARALTWYSCRCTISRIPDPDPGKRNGLRTEVLRRRRHGRHPDHGRL